VLLPALNEAAALMAAIVFLSAGSFKYNVLLSPTMYFVIHQTGGVVYG
jgi:hypothetical protein